jgi:ketopantoate reductase
MTQDILLRGSGLSEIDSLTGYIVRLADQHHVSAPYNKTIYRLAKERFGPNFQPLRCEDVLAEVIKTKHTDG